MKRNFLTLAVAGLIFIGGISVLQAQGRQHGGGARRHGLDQMTQGLNLTPDQQAKVQPIIDKATPEIAAIHRECMQKTKAVIASTASQIRPLLTPEQQKTLDENEHARRGRGVKGHQGPSNTTDDD